MGLTNPRRINAIGPGEEGMVIPWTRMPVRNQVDGTVAADYGASLINYSGGAAAELRTSPPAIDYISTSPAINVYFELMLFEYGSFRGFFNNSDVAVGTVGSAFQRNVYRLRAHLSQYDGFEAGDYSNQQGIGIMHGSFEGDQAGAPWPATTTGTIAQFRISPALNITRTLPLPPGARTVNCSLLYGPGGGAAWTVKNLGDAILPATGGECGALLELEVDYPRRMIRGRINGRLAGEMPMTGWNGTRQVNSNGLPAGSGGTCFPWMSIFSNTGTGNTPINWYQTWINMEMGILLDPSRKVEGQRI